MNTSLLWGLALLASTTWSIGWSADRALIVGVGRYAESRNNLPGIDLDVQMAREMAILMGYEEDGIRVLTDHDATAKAIMRAIRDWLVKGVGPDDRAFFYFSGHGGWIKDLNGDEADGRDEYITGYDVAGSRSRLRGVIVDDDLQQLLAKVESTQFLVMIDACNSGTLTREITLESDRLGGGNLVSKFHRIQGQEYPKRLVVGKNQDGRTFFDKDARFVGIFAAREFEEARASRQGSLFTLGAHQAISSAARSASMVSPEQVRQAAEQYIARILEDDPDGIHIPVVAGSKALASAGLPLVSSRNGQGPNWTRMLELASSGQPLDLNSSRLQYQIQDEIEVVIAVPRDGYLNVITVDAADEAVVLFPNQYAQDNRVRAGIMNLPTASMPFILEAAEPRGQSIIVAIITHDAVNLYHEALDVRGRSGAFTEVFGTLSQRGYRSIRVSARHEGGSGGDYEAYTGMVQIGIQ